MSRMSPEIAEMIHRILIVSRNKGADPVHAMNMAGLIRHGGTVRQDWVECLDAAISSVRTTPFQDMDHRDLPRTPMDFKNQMLQILEGMKERLISEFSEK